jgi:hypothetical protein
MSAGGSFSLQHAFDDGYGSLIFTAISSLSLYTFPLSGMHRNFFSHQEIIPKKIDMES